MRNRIFALGLLATFTAFSYGRTITVSSPTANTFLGKSNSVSFNITGAEFEVLVTVKATNVGSGQSVKSEKRFTPNAQNQINDSVPLNFSDSAPQGAWTIVVTPTEKDENGNDLAYSPKFRSIPIQVDVKAPTFFTINPLNNSYVKGAGANQIVHINATLNEPQPNLDKWNVQINGGDIPDNTGSTLDVNVDWSAKGITKDGPQSVSIKVDDKAKNSATKTFTVNLDRIKPSCKIVTPGPTTPIPPHTNIPVLIEIKDQFSDSVDVTGVSVVVKTLANKYITRVARSAVNSNGTTLSWSGRIRSTSKIPNEFKIVVTAYDKAGNPAAIQETRVKIGNR